MNRKHIKIYLIISIILMVLIIFCNYENNHIGLTKYQYKTNKLSKKFKIIQISDFHNKKIKNNNEQLINIVEKEQPNIIVITGDFIDSRKTNTDISLKLAKQLYKIAPTYFVTGNHERSVDPEILYDFEDKLSNVGVQVMYDKNIKINDEITLMGLDDLSLGTERLNELVDKTSSDNLRILLAHEPQYFNDYVDSGVDIVFSGHAHGGQIRIPFTNIGLVAPNQGLFPKYTSGKYSEKDTSMYVSRGIGNSILPLRIFNCPEIVELEIMPEDK